jgi:UDP-GlcNAc:undecaprenyl-phosphate/decaprenyl-phosphate GlcNAc-1-phosphate transferase
MLTTVLVAFGVTLAISPAALVGLRRLGVIDVPTHRSSHEEPTPRGGGIAVGIGAAFALVTTADVPGRPWIGVLVAAVTFGAVGLFDDLLDVPPLWRLACQVAAAACVLSWLPASTDSPVILQVGMALLTAFWLVGFVNAFNFMDGINGISIVQVLVAAMAWIAVAETQELPALATVSAVLAAASLGFAPFNFPRARMFLGDAGSYFIGAWLAAAAVIALRAGVPPEAVLAPLALYLADTGATLVRRVWRRERWYVAHHDHTYQRLVDRGWSHQTTTLTVGLFQVVVSGLGLLSLTGSVGLRVAGDIVAAIVLAVYLWAPNWLASHEHPLAPARSS